MQHSRLLQRKKNRHQKATATRPVNMIYVDTLVFKKP